MTIREQLAEEHRDGKHDHALQDGVGIDDCPLCEEEQAIYEETGYSRTLPGK